MHLPGPISVSIPPQIPLNLNPKLETNLELTLSLSSSEWPPPKPNPRLSRSAVQRRDRVVASRRASVRHKWDAEAQSVPLASARQARQARRDHTQAGLVRPITVARVSPAKADP